MEKQSYDHFNICVKVLEASDLPNLNTSSLICVQVGDEKRCTKVVKHTDKPNFNEYFVFNLCTNFSTLMNTVISISMFEKRKKFKLKKLIGCIFFDVATVWIHTDNQFTKWFAITLPSDITAKAKAYMKCDIRVVVAESFHQLLGVIPVETPDVLGELKARYMVRVYHCAELEVNDIQKDVSEVYVNVLFAGKSGTTTKRLLRESSEWNEQITFIELFPPLYQKITIELVIDQKKLDFKDLYLYDMSKYLTENCPPSYGPTYIHFYLNDTLYVGSLLIAIETEPIMVLKHSEIFHRVTIKPIQSLTPDQYGHPERFLFYGVIFEAILTEKILIGKDFNFTLNFGSVGRRSNDGKWEKTITDQYKALQSSGGSVYLPINENKPCVFACSEWPNTCHRLYNSNMLTRLAQDLKTRVSYTQDLISRGSVSEAKKILKSFLQTFKKECTRTLEKLSKGITTLDSERVYVIYNQLNHLLSTVIDVNDTEQLLKKSNMFISVLDTICDDAQDSLPNILICLKHGHTVIGYCKLHSREIIFSKTDLKRGIHSGRISSVFLKNTDQIPLGRLDIWLWLGFYNQVSYCLKELPPGHEDVTKPVLLPPTLTYITNQSYAAICHIFAGNISELNSEGVCNFFVRVLFSNQCNQTKVIKNSIAPLWKETIIFTDVKLYPLPAYIERNPPSITIELWNQMPKYETLTGTALVFPKVRSHIISKTLEYNLQWNKLEPHSQILAFFEIILITEEGESSSVSSKYRLTEIIPRFLEPPTVSNRLEIIFWGIRPVDIGGLKGINRPQVIVQCDSTELKSSVIVHVHKYPNFQHDLHIIHIELSEIKLYSLPLVIRVLASSGYIGSFTDNNIHRYLCEMPTKKQWDILCTRRQIVNESLSWVKHESRQTLMPDLIPLIEIDANQHPTRLQEPQFGLARIILPLVTCFKEIFVCLRSPLYYLRNRWHVEQLQQKDEEEYCWWYKYFTGKIKIYTNELEYQKEFSGFNDVLRSFIIKQKTSGKLPTVRKVKAIMCLYPWPSEKQVVTQIGQDPDTGVLKHIELSDCIKILVRVYCIKAHNLQPNDLNNKADPFIEIATPSNYVSDKSHYIPKQLNPVFGRCLEITASFPVDSILVVRVMDWDRFSDHDIIGETVIDLEDRFYSKHRATCGLPSVYLMSHLDLWRDIEKPTVILERLCNNYNLPLPQYTEKSVFVASKEFFVQDKFKNQEEIKENLALTVLNKWSEIPIVGHTLVSEHVETRSLFCKNRPGLEQGKLELWVDLFDLSMGKVPPPIDISPRKPQAYELRVIVWNTAKIPLVDDSYFVGRKHSDIYVKGWLGDPDTAQNTDVHYLSINGEGNFNWRFIFPFLYLPLEKRIINYKKNVFDITKTEHKVPAHCHLQVWDSDRLSADDFIGSMVLDLSRMPKGSRSRRTCKIQENLTLSNSVDLFRVKRLKGWWPFLQNKNNAKLSKAGFLEAEFQLLTADEAIVSPVGLGRSPPSALPPPIRPETTFRFWLAPIRVVTHLIFGLHRSKMILCLFTCSISVFVLIGIYSIPMFIMKKIIGA